MGQAPPARDPYLSHWADNAAARTIAANPDVDELTVAAGITPSGVVHIGNFREVITVDLVARALRDRGKTVRFIYSWDDFDVFRKVPKGMPQPEMLEENLRRSIADVPDPYGEHDSYASHNIAAFEHSLAPLGISPEFIRQHRMYRKGTYAEGIRKALEQREAIKRILDQHRKEPLADDWLPLAGFCDGCGRDEIDFSWDGEWIVHATCRSCAHEADVDLRQGGNVKLPWRVDWPMRWAHERVRFEPGGKDHSSAGGSYDTGKEIVREVYGFRAPEYVAYDFVRIKGAGGKISSSKGGAITVADCLEVYEPQVLRWLFVSYRANSEFQISFDLDVIKIYEDHDRQVRLAHEAEDGGKKDKKRQVARRALELASVDHHRITPGEDAPWLPPFRAVSMTMQIYDGDVDRTVAHYRSTGECETEADQARLERRARCAWAWIENYAPDDFRYRIRTEPKQRALSADERTVLDKLVGVLRDNPGISEQDLVPHMKTLTEGTGIGNKEFFPVAYDLLIDRPKGPKLTTLLTTMGTERALPLLAASLA
jgi:lysyl-tRNA synthetase class 1